MIKSVGSQLEPKTTHKEQCMNIVAALPGVTAVITKRAAVIMSANAITAAAAIMGTSLINAAIVVAASGHISAFVTRFIRISAMAVLAVL